MRGRGLGILAGTVVVAGSLLAGGAAQPGYKEWIESWRREREARLKADDGWLTVAGLFWLNEGPNRFGSDPSNDIVLPPGSAPRRAGIFEFQGGRITVSVEPGAVVTSAGTPVETMELRPDSTGSPDLLTLGDLTMFVIQRGDRHGIRLRDKNSPARRDFKGLEWFRVSEAYRVTAAFVPYDAPRRVPIPNVLGQTEELLSPGYVAFTLRGRALRLDPVLEHPDSTELFFIFSDPTSGKETYPAGRFLHADLPKDGKVLLDFNKAYSPPCAFTPYATCPLPPEQNRLRVRIEAGEKRLADHR